VKAKGSRREAEYYLRQNYPVVLQRVEESEGGGYRASIPQLGWRTFVAAGDTPQEALDNLEELRRLLIPELIARGEQLPDAVPDVETPEAYSGNLVVRIPKALHAWLAQEAKRNNCSINKLVTHLLSEAKGERRLAAEILEAVSARQGSVGCHEAEQQVGRTWSSCTEERTSWVMAEGSRPTVPAAGYGHRANGGYNGSGTV